ncbi:hypothetical protein [Aquamicrobium defluvii]|uniref:Uncharacterized protein n=1 Tax=Aquamicrobium defluvii TaxID=69279 RepID=A0A4V3DKG1_9HYPH|nr:hypothetical protein [Aquamicrobium defluvii]TDR34140.1 hypothetical protein DES43_11645 [Aquamicrobium defluvii]
MSVLGEHLAGGTQALPNSFYRARPQVLRIVLQTLERALTATVTIVGDVRIHEPRFTRQLFLDFERARDETPGSPRYDITHQPELPIADDTGAVAVLRRLDLRILFQRQVGRTGDYLCLECKYLDANDRGTDREYVDEGVDRIVIGDYAANHPWAVMVGLERTGPLDLTACNVNARLIAKYGLVHGFKSKSDIRLANVHESDHLQADGPHQITIIHALYLITPAKADLEPNGARGRVGESNVAS